MKSYWKDKRILITGAAGFVGSNAVIFFHSLGAFVTGIVSPTTSQNKLEIKLGKILNKVNIVRSNLLFPEDFAKLINSETTVLHFAALDGSYEYKRTHSADIFTQNMRINLNILEACSHTKVKTLLLLGSADIYANSIKPISENDPVDFKLETGIDGYKLAKWTTEMAAKEFHRQYGLNNILIRPSNIYGPGDEFENDERMRFIPSVIKKILRHEPVVLWGTGNQRRVFLYVDDFLSICGSLIENNFVNMPVNIASVHTTTLKEIAEKIRTISQEDASIIIDETKPGGPNIRTYNTSLLKKNLPNISEISLEEGLKNTYSFYKKFYK
jgi:GDP-L-fucose synthase